MIQFKELWVIVYYSQYSILHIPISDNVCPLWSGNSVRLLLTKNPACSCDCPWCQVYDISFERFPRPWQKVGPVSGSSFFAGSTLAFCKEVGSSSGVAPSLIQLHNHVWWVDASRKRTSTTRARRQRGDTIGRVINDADQMLDSNTYRLPLDGFLYSFECSVDFVNSSKQRTFKKKHDRLIVFDETVFLVLLLHTGIARVKVEKSNRIILNWETELKWIIVCALYDLMNVSVIEVHELNFRPKR